MQNFYWYLEITDHTLRAWTFHQEAEFLPHQPLKNKAYPAFLAFKMGIASEEA